MYRNMSDQRYSDMDGTKRDIPSFIEPRPPLIQNPFMRPRPQKGTNLLELFEEDSEIEEPELVQVYLRLKPCNVPNTLYEVRNDRCLVTSLDTATAGHGRRTQHNVSKMYTFSKIFGSECNQKEIFEQVVKDNLKKLPDGHNFTLLTYGASGSGKTYTLMGTVGAPGLVPRSLEYVFRLVDAAQQPLYKPAENGAEKLSYAEQDFELQWVKRLRHVSAPLRDKYRRMSVQLHTDLTISSIDLTNRVQHYVWVSFVEIYNEAIYDLLAPPDKRAKLRIREDSSGNVYVKGATHAFVRSGEEAYDVMVAGKHNLVVAATGVHAHSSRSHCIFTITMLTETGGGSVRASCVRLCDLAGCERARATRNTGARMAESRAINSSLHVLERCLHMLRRKQRTRNDALVPYRESKLTRLLGTGLSGAKGEAVSMVVTLNPSPEYAHETKHVLSLAAVAQDIQINNTTMLGTTLECSTQDTTINCSSEVMKLRSDNERLHFELVQAQARNKELMASMEERQQEAAITMKELVEEAKDMTRQYYVAQLEALQSEMDDMVEEYECRLSKAAKNIPPPPSNGTPSRYLQNKVTQLMTEIAVLEEQLTAERLARGRAEKEVEHLRTCIEERDEKAFKDATPPQRIILSDSENESDEETSDPFNESLEPVFKKESNKSISMAKHNETVSVHTIDNIEEEDDEMDGELDDEVSRDTIKDNYIENIRNNDAEIDNNDKNNSFNDISKSEDSIEPNTDVTYEPDSANSTYHSSDTNKYDESVKNDTTQNFNDKNESIKSAFIARGTYFVSDIKAKEENNTSQDSNKSNNICRGTYFVDAPSSENDECNKSITEVVFKEPVMTKPVNKVEKRELETLVSKIVKSLKTKESSDSSLRQFEQLEMETETKAENDECNKNITEVVFKEPVVTKPVNKVEKRESETLVSKIVKSLKTKESSDSSLRQFEQLEMETDTKAENDAIQNQSVYGDIKVNYFDNEKRTYFDNEPSKITKEVISDVVTSKDKRSYFDNIDVVELNSKKINEIKNMDEERSPSIVKDNVAAENFEPSKIKMLLGESFTKLEIVTSVQKKRLAKKHESVDIFDSPAIKTDDIDNIEIARQSIQKLVLEQSGKKIVNRNNDQTPIKIDTHKSPLKDKEFSIKTAVSQIDNDILKLRDKNQEVNDKYTSPKKNNFVKMSDLHDIIIPSETKSTKKIDTKTEKIKEGTNADAEKEIIFKFESANNDSSDDFKDVDIKKYNEKEKRKVIKKELTEEVKTKPFTDTERKIMPEIPSVEVMNATKDNTIEEFENIYNDISAPRATEFELLISMNETGKADKEETKYNLRKKNSKMDETKHEKLKTGISDEVLLESQSKCESKVKRPLRLRRRKNQGDEDSEGKLKDIVNLQTEFSDVTMDVPAPQKVVKDIPSPEKGTEENLPPLCVQSCPAKSITRSRRKLFTPRAEPLEESLSQTGDSNERIYVPRPSYHRPRARRKL